MIQIFLICSLGIRLLPEIVNSVNDDEVSQQMKVDGKYGLYIKESGGSWEIITSSPKTPNRREFLKSSLFSSFSWC